MQFDKDVTGNVNMDPSFSGDLKKVTTGAAI
jgi:hypothetical protein